MRKLTERKRCFSASASGMVVGGACFFFILFYFCKLEREKIWNKGREANKRRKENIREKAKDIISSDGERERKDNEEEK